MISWLTALPWAIAAAGVIGGGAYGLIESNNYHAEKAARAEDRIAAEKAKSMALVDAQKRSDDIIAGQAAALAVTAAKVSSITERIIHVPVTTACGDTPAMRAANDGMQHLFPNRSAGGGDPQAGRGAAPAVPRSGTR